MQSYSGNLSDFIFFMLKTILILIALGSIWGRDNQYFPILINNSPIFLQGSLPTLIQTKKIELANTIPQEQNLELKVHQQVNQYRQSLNLPPLQLNSLISEQARLHSERMASKSSSFSHNGFSQRIQIISRQIPYRSAAENIAYNQGYTNPVSIAVKGWIKSPEHHKNMIGNFNLTGIGIAKNSQGEYYFTQIFILKR